MQIKKVLSKKEIEDIEAILEKNYGCKIDLKKFFIFMTSDNKIWIANKEAENVIKGLRRCYRIGIYFGKLKRNNKIKLSIEGALMVGRNANKNIAVVDEKEAIKFMEGYDVSDFKAINAELHNFIIVKNDKNDVLGAGILREGYIENLIPKARRLKAELME
ncbi:MAG: hypothetical protein J7L80_00875 [Thermoplasmata archaeon]|nr:hypothetical protein [Thermoplasmata archaeon]